MNAKGWTSSALALLLAWAVAAGELRRESFDRDPGWDGHNNRSAKPEAVRQDFGWNPATVHAGGGAGEIGGFINPAAEPAYFAKQLPTLTLNDRLSASGRIFVAKGSGHTLLGFFNAETLNEWRTPNTIALRINQRGDVFHCHLEHCTRLWRAGAGIIGEYDKVRDRMYAKELPSGRAYPERLAAFGDRLKRLTLERPLRASGKVCLRRGVSDSTTLLGFYDSTHSLQVNPSQQFSTPKDFLGVAIEGPSSEGFYFYPVYRNHGDGTGNGAGAKPPRIYPDSRNHDWTLEYDPAGAGGHGTINVTLDDQTVTIALAPGDKAAGAQFDRFGLVTPWIDGNGQHVYFDDLTYACSQF